MDNINYRSASAGNMFRNNLWYIVDIIYPSSHPHPQKLRYGSFTCEPGIIAYTTHNFPGIILMFPFQHFNRIQIQSLCNTIPTFQLLKFHNSNTHFILQQMETCFFPAIVFDIVRFFREWSTWKTWNPIGFIASVSPVEIIWILRFLKLCLLFLRDYYI